MSLRLDDRVGAITGAAVDGTTWVEPNNLTHSVDLVIDDLDGRPTWQ